MKKETSIKGYKGFNVDKDGKLFCDPQGKKYYFIEGKTYEEKIEPQCCRQGFHLCEEPIDVLGYYDILDNDCNQSAFAEVKGFGVAHKSGDKTCVAKIKIGVRFNFVELVFKSIEKALKLCKSLTKKTSSLKNDNGADYARIGSSGDLAQIGSSGASAQIGSSGDCARIGSSGYSARIGSSGASAQIGSSGHCARIGSSGYCARIGSSGYSAQIGSSGDCAVVSAIGRNSRIRAKKDSWIVLAEYDDNGKPLCVKTAQIDGKLLKEDVFYKLKNGEFKEA